jgi:alpha-glucosidase
VLARSRLVTIALPLACAVSACLGRTQAPVPVKAAPAKTTPAASVLSSVRSPGGIEITTTAGVMQVTTPRPDTFRIHWAKGSDSKGLPSFAIELATLQGGSAPKIEESETLLMLRSERALLRIDKQPLRITLMDDTGAVIAEDVAAARFDEGGVALDFGLARGERVFGLGDKLQGFDRRGKSFELWNTDAFGFKVDDDPLYKSLPFLLFLGGKHAHGLFIDHPARATLDVGKANPERLSYRAKAGDALDVYLFAGRDPKQVLEAYTALTGRTPLPPLWALGHHQSRYGYMTEAEVRGVVARMQKGKIPLDAVWLDIDFQADNTPFTVNKAAFPGFAKMVKDFRAAGVATVVITDMHVKSYQGKPSPGYAPYDSGASGDHFVHGPNGFFEGPVWPGQSVFPELTRERTRVWWGSLYADFVAQGVAGFWNDMNEPAVFIKEKTFPETIQHRLEDGRSASHTLIHNAYGALNAQATYEGVRKLRPDERPFVLTRAAYAGVQKYAASWTGDNTADRAHLAATIPQLLNLGISGYPFNGADVGGFVGCPDAELFAEWMELGALQPFFRNHSKKDACRREPWVFGAAVEERARKAVERRYRLLPYLYTAFEESSRNGAPIMRPLWFEYPADGAAYDTSNVYLLGRDLLVAPKLRAGANEYSVVLPGGDWYDTESLALVPSGNRELESGPTDSVRLFARAGSIIPQGPVMQSAHEAPQGSLLLDVWPGPDCSGSLYIDDGRSFAYQNGAFRRLSFACEPGSASLDVTSSSSGNFAPWWQDVRIVLHDVPAGAITVTDGASTKLPFVHDAAKKSLTVTLPKASTDFKIHAEWLRDTK